MNRKTKRFIRFGLGNIRKDFPDCKTRVTVLGANLLTEKPIPSTNLVKGESFSDGGIDRFEIEPLTEEESLYFRSRRRNERPCMPLDCEYCDQSIQSWFSKYCKPSHDCGRNQFISWETIDDWRIRTRKSVLIDQ